MRLGFHAIALPCTLPVARQAARPSYGIDDAVTVAKKQNLEIAIVRKQIQAARGGFVEARWLFAIARFDRPVRQTRTPAGHPSRDEDYNVSRAGRRAQGRNRKGLNSPRSEP